MENIIVNLLLYSSHDMLEYFDDLELFLDYKFHIMKRLREREEVLYYRLIIRTLITEY